MRRPVTPLSGHSSFYHLSGKPLGPSSTRDQNETTRDLRLSGPKFRTETVKHRDTNELGRLIINYTPNVITGDGPPLGHPKTSLLRHPDRGP